MSKKSDIRIENYSEKSFVLLGNTKIYKEDIKQLGGKFNSKLTENRVGWIFPMNKKQEVQNWINGENIQSEKITPNNSNQSIELLKKILRNQEQILRNQDRLLKNQPSIQRREADHINSSDEEEESMPRQRFLTR